MQSTTYIHHRLEYFFSPSEQIDIELGSRIDLSINGCLSVFEENKADTNKLLNTTFRILNKLFTKGYFILNENTITEFLNLDGFRSTLFCLQHYIDQISSIALHQVTIQHEMIMKNLLNILYVCIVHMNHVDQETLRSLLNELQLDNLMIKMITLTLEVHYLPIKKIVILYTKVLSILFGKSNIYSDAELLSLGKENQLPEDYLNQLKINKSPQTMAQLHNPVQQFYKKHNSGDCPLAQSIVVGLLRSLLTVCNSQNHKKFIPKVPKGSGVDSYRQWQLSYQYAIVSEQTLSQPIQKMIKSYSMYNQGSESSSSTHHEFYSHKIYTTSAISVFFSFLLISFKNNRIYSCYVVLIQYTYLFQLISDANGILVFLKFLTDKFDSLQPIQLRPKELSFQNEVMLTVFSVLSVLYGACNNYTQKTKSYLFQYNSYLIIKKIPHLFMEGHSHDEQLPSQKQIQEEFGVNNMKQPMKIKLKQLTQLCYQLLKIQIPFFSKKMKENSNNMKMIVDIYCQLPKHVEPIERTQIEKLYLKTKFRKIKSEKWVKSIEQLKIIHNDYNNYYYWANDHAKSEPNEKEPARPIEMSSQMMDKWLEQNVWRYYD